MNEKNYICEKCGPITKTKVESRLETFPVKGEDTVVSTTVRVCEHCGETVFDRELDSENLRMAYDAYRRKNNIITPNEIRALREKYDLSQRSLGTLLGWGEITIHRYEGGSLPDEAHNQVLRLIQDPLNMQQLFVEYGNRMNQSAYRKLERRLSELLTERMPEKVIEIFSRAAKGRKPDLFTGYRVFSPEALMEMIVFFAAKPDGVLKTKLNKLLWYADFTHFRKYTASISGATYIHLPYGPVPDQYELYLCSLSESGDLIRSDKPIGDYWGEVLESRRVPNMDILSTSANEVLEAIYKYFRNVNSKQISDISHKEAGYAKTEQGEPISYEYADELLVIV